MKKNWSYVALIYVLCFDVIQVSSLGDAMISHQETIIEPINEQERNQLFERHKKMDVQKKEQLTEKEKNIINNAQNEDKNKGELTSFFEAGKEFFKKLGNRWKENNAASKVQEQIDARKKEIELTLAPHQIDKPFIHSLKQPYEIQA